MAVKIELLAISPKNASLALYYQIASPAPAADDQTRIPAGDRLSAPELQALKDGTLFELVKSISLSGMTKAQAKASIEGFWGERKAGANRAYIRAYRDADLIGKAFDGTSWS